MIIFRNTLHALGWYALHREFVGLGAGTVETIGKYGIMGFTPEPNYNFSNTIDIEDKLLTVFDLDKMLGNFPKHTQEALYIYGATLEKSEGIKYLRKDVRRLPHNVKSMSFSSHQRYFNNILRQFYKLLKEHGYIKPLAETQAQAAESA